MIWGWIWDHHGHPTAQGWIWDLCGHLTAQDGFGIAVVPLRWPLGCFIPPQPGVTLDSVPQGFRLLLASPNACYKLFKEKQQQGHGEATQFIGEGWLRTPPGDGIPDVHPCCPPCCPFPVSLPAVPSQCPSSLSLPAVPSVSIPLSIPLSILRSIPLSTPCPSLSPHPQG